MGLNPLNPPRELGAGNFVFLLEDNLNDDATATRTAIGGRGRRAQHRLAGARPGRRQPLEPRPGGTFPSAALGCTSCHDPHGNASFRMLHGAGPVQNGAGHFPLSRPTSQSACRPPTRPRWRAAPLTAPTCSGMTRWCANCHGFYHDSGHGDLRTPRRRRPRLGRTSPLRDVRGGCVPDERQRGVILPAGSALRIHRRHHRRHFRTRQQRPAPLPVLPPGPRIVSTSCRTLGLPRLSAG
jgi:hypothetical protein